MSKKRRRETALSLPVAERAVGQITETFEVVKHQLDAAFRLMNTYAQDPHNMGATNSKGEPMNLMQSIDPQAVLAEVYFILAPAQIALTKTADDPDFQAVRADVIADIKSEVARERRRANGERQRIDAEAKRHAKEKIANMAELDQIEAMRRAEVDAYFHETQRHVRQDHKAGKRVVEI